MPLLRCVCVGMISLLVALAAIAQDTPAAPARGEATAAGVVPNVRLPRASELGLATPRPVRAVTAALGLGRQRLALVVGNGMVGANPVLPSAPRDAQAVAAMLRSAGFLVMLREDLTAADLRASLAEFRERLQPGGVGFVYVTALAVQVGGQNLWLPREAPLDRGLPPADLAQRLGQVGVPVSEIVDALLGTPDSPRLLVLDAAYQHPALAALPQPGLAEQKLPPGMVALFSSALGMAQARPAAADLPAAPAGDRPPPAELAASRFARTLVAALAVPRVTGAEALRTTRRVLFDSTQGQTAPWLSGDNDSREEFAESTLLDSLIPRTPEDFAREALKQATSKGRRAAGEQTVAEVLQQSAQNSAAGPAGSAGDAMNPGNGRMTPQSATRPTLPATPSAGSLASSLGTAASTVATVAGVGAAVAGVAAATAADAVVAVQVASMAAGAVGTVGSVASGAGSVVGNMVALASRLGADGSVAAPATAAAMAAAPAAAALQPAAVAAAAVAASSLATAAAAAPAVAVAQGAMATTASTAARAARPAQAAPLDGRTARNATGGERPVYAPRTNNFGYAEGDTFTYQVRDTWKGEVTGSYTTAIEEVLGDGQLLANGAQVQMDAQGRITQLRGSDGSVSTFEPRQDLWWSNPQRGERREVLFKETFQRADASRGHTEWKGSTSVGRPRKIDTPAGPFEVLPIESSGWYYESLDGGGRTSGQWSRTVWYSTKLGHPVAIDIEDADRLGKLLRRERVELMHAQTSRGAP